MRKPTTTTSHRQPRGLRAALPGTVGLLGLVAAVALSLIVPNAGAQNTNGQRDATQIRFQGFETGLGGVSPLNSQSQIVRVTGGYNGSAYAARLRGPQGKLASVGLTNVAPFVATTKLGNRYIVTAWVKAEGAALSKGALTVRVDVSENAGQVSKNAAWRQFHLTNNAWQQVRVPLTARAAGHEIKIKASVPQLPAGGMLRIDGLSLRVGPLLIPPAPRLAGTAFGTSVDEGNLDWLSALHQSDLRYGRLGVVRVFEPGLPGPWTGRIGELNRPFIYSFRANPTGVIAGQYDKQFTDWFKKAPEITPSGGRISTSLKMTSSAVSTRQPNTVRPGNTSTNFPRA